eukprot:2736018-Prymnesium_polylepis.1
MAIAAAPGVVLLAGLPLVPPSPFRLLRRGRRDEAIRLFVRLYGASLARATSSAPGRHTESSRETSPSLLSRQPSRQSYALPLLPDDAHASSPRAPFQPACPHAVVGAPPLPPSLAASLP